jgi:hypothetical protein
MTREAGRHTPMAKIGTKNVVYLFPEKFNGTLEKMLMKRVNDSRNNWDVILHECMFAYNTSIQATTKYSPFYLMYGR